MAIATPNGVQRRVLSQLSSGEWRMPVQLHTMLADDFIERLMTRGWIEQRGSGKTREVRITEAGFKRSGWISRAMLGLLSANKGRI